MLTLAEDLELPASLFFTKDLAPQRGECMMIHGACLFFKRACKADPYFADK